MSFFKTVTSDLSSIVDFSNILFYVDCVLSTYTLYVCMHVCLCLCTYISAYISTYIFKIQQRANISFKFVIFVYVCFFFCNMVNMQKPENSLWIKFAPLTFTWISVVRMLK